VSRQELNKKTTKVEAEIEIEKKQDTQKAEVWYMSKK
jgi:hypothetical protein